MQYSFMKRIKLCVLLVFASALTVHSQSIKGKLVDLVDNKPLAGATLSLKLVKDTTRVFRNVTDSKGQFEFNNLTKDSFVLTVSFIGYENYKQFINLNDSIPDADLGNVLVPKRATEIGGVIVVSKTPPVQQKGDTAQYNASQYKVNPDATTEDLIKKMPGITVDKSGTVTAQGEQVKKVTIDGRDFFGDDATAALRNLPSTIVDKIQVFDRLSDQAQFTGFDDGNSVKAINIVTKSGIKNGQFGRIYAGYGTDDRYSAGGNVSFFKGDRRISLVGNFNNVNQQNFASQDLLGVTSSSGGNRGGGGNFGGGNRGGSGGGGNRGGGGIGGVGGGENFTVGQQSGISKTNAVGINFGDKWGKNVDVTGSYFFNNSNNLNDNLTKQQIIGTNQLSSDSSLSKNNNYNHRINLRLEYRIDSFNSIIVSPSLNFQKNESIAESDYYTLDGTDTLNTQNSNSSILRTGYNLRNNILFRHSFKSNRKRTFSINFSQTFNKNNAESYIYSDNRVFKGGIVDDSLQNQYINNPTNGYTLSGNVSYTEPLGQKSMLQFSYQPSYSKNNADQEAFNYSSIDDKYSEFISANSNKFENITTTQNGGITYRLGVSRDNQFSVGVNLQHSRLQSDRIYPTISSIDQTFTNLLPNLMWRRKINARNSINLFYRASTNFPSVTQLQDVVNNSNLLKLSIGNPDLKQSYNHFLSARYIFTNTQKGQSFFANIFLNAQQNYISNATYIATKDSLIQQGNVVDSGAQLIKPVNLDGYKSFRSFFTFSQPVKFIKSNINLSTGFSYTASPALYNNIKSMTNNYTYNAGIVIASNISEYIDFNLNYNANFNVVKNAIQNLYQNYVNQSAGIQFNLLSKNGWFLQNDLSNQSNSGLSAGLNQNYWLWNAAVGKKFLKNKSGELKLYAFDLLKQNQSITRTIDPNNPNYITDSRSKVLQRYFMLTFTYSLKNFGKANTNNFQRRDRGPMF
jgi:uncharacterized membrane protein YgcG